MNPAETCKVSLDSSEIASLKRTITNDRPYANRISLGFAFRLLSIKATLREDQLILDEIDNLEALKKRSRTRREEKFRKPPLHPFWHKHYTAPRHILKNIANRWNLTGDGKPLLAMLGNVATTHGSDLDDWPGIAAYRMVIDGYTHRAKRGLTGDWIIFGKHAGKNYYLDLATHHEGDEPERLYEKLRQGSAAEFPFLFV